MIQCAHDTQTATSVNQFGELAEEFPAATALSAVCYPLREPYPVNEKFTLIKFLKYAEVLNQQMI